MNALVTLRQLTVDFRQNEEVLRALHGIDLEIRRGEALGLVGESGCGKSVTWLAALGLLPKTALVGGEVLLEGVDLLQLDANQLASTRGKRIAMIFQDATSALNPVHTIGRQIGEALRLHRGLSGTAVRAEVRRLLDRVGIGDAARRLDQYPHELSGGMNQRVMIAMAIAGQPDLLIADEPTTALDVTIQAQILELLHDLRSELGMALVLISHDLGVIAENCERVAVMYAGRVIEQAPVEDLFETPSHPYTQGLLNALPDIEGARRGLEAIPGTVPDPRQLSHGCAFAPRCDRANARCSQTIPALEELYPAHAAACLRHSHDEPLKLRGLAE